MRQIAKDLVNKTMQQQENLHQMELIVTGLEANNKNIRGPLGTLIEDLFKLISQLIRSNRSSNDVLVQQIAAYERYIQDIEGNK